MSGAKLLAALTLVALLAVHCRLALAEPWELGTEAALYHDNNINNAQTSRDIKSDTVFSASASAFQTLALGELATMSLGGELKGESHRHYGGLDHVSLGADAVINRKWGLGPYVPWTRLSLSLNRLNYANGIRDGWQSRAAFATGERLTQRWSVWLEYALERRSARSAEPEVSGISGDAFSTRGHSLSANGRYDWSDSLSLQLAGLVHHGDVVATTHPGLGIYRISKAIAEDPVFGDDFYAYVVAATSYGINAELSYAVNSHAALGFALLRQVTHGAGGNNYSKTIPSLNWSYSY